MENRKKFFTAFLTLFWKNFALQLFCAGAVFGNFCAFLQFLHHFRFCYFLTNFNEIFLFSVYSFVIKECWNKHNMICWEKYLPKGQYSNYCGPWLMSRKIVDESDFYQSIHKIQTYHQSYDECPYCLLPFVLDFNVIHCLLEKRLANLTKLNYFSTFILVMIIFCM